jgi:hypothetical protein
VLQREHDHVLVSDDIDDQFLSFYLMKLMLQIFDLLDDDEDGSIFDEISRLEEGRLL